jgi:hypothetical protein
LNGNPLENEELSSPEQAPVAAPAAAAPTPAVPAFDPRRRIRELMSIPERDRTDAEWDELNELEIQTAPGNRSGNAQPYYATNKPGGGSGFPQKSRNKNKQRKPGGQGGNRPQQQGNKPNKPPRPV